MSYKIELHQQSKNDLTSKLLDTLPHVSDDGILITDISVITFWSMAELQ